MEKGVGMTQEPINKDQLGAIENIPTIISGSGVVRKIKARELYLNIRANRSKERARDPYSDCLPFYILLPESFPVMRNLDETRITADAWISGTMLYGYAGLQILPRILIVPSEIFAGNNSNEMIMFRFSLDDFSALQIKGES